ncbi:hypothetical protein FDECE_2606 [Fusarium decemcellulare]|nr:hypothetical protein FDECE_2606 [Fusarium decemcellulare]
MTKPSNSVSAPILRLPNELVCCICDLLPNSAIKNLRLACRFLSDKTRLRLSRVFISPSQRNISVLRSIAEHDTFRQCVEEIIWDDATLGPMESDEGTDYYGLGLDEEDTQEDMPEWFIQRCKISIEHLKSRMGRRPKRPDTVARQEELDNSMSFRESFKYYRVLLQQQQQILASHADENVFRYALQRFPRLKRVTVTPAAHGFLFEPLYKTPMIRDLPYGFLYPIPRGWLVGTDGFSLETPSPWAGDASEEKKNEWRGFRIVTRILAEVQHHHVSELVLDNHKHLTGINHFAFHPPTEEYHNLSTVLRRPGFRRVDLSLLTGRSIDGEAEDWDSYRNGDLHKALAGAPDLEHVVLQTDYYDHGIHGRGSMDEFVSLFSVFPIDHWTKLKHFGLSSMQVTQSDLVSFLAKLPSTLQSVELSFLAFLQDQGNYAGLLSDIRDKLGWRDRPVDMRVKMRVLIRSKQLRVGRYISLDKEVVNYVYGLGPAPFSATGHINRGAGVEKDEVNPHWKRPLKTLKYFRY